MKLYPHTSFHPLLSSITQAKLEEGENDSKRLRYFVHTVVCSTYTSNMDNMRYPGIHILNGVHI